MALPPLVSMVMSTYNDADTLSSSIESVLSQEFADFEFIIVNDGSPDPRTAEILADYAQRDARVRVLTKANEGLTKALIDGCAAARGEHIGRQDADDVSLPGRLAAQVAFLAAHPDVGLCTCGTRVVAPDGEWIEDVLPPADSASATRLLREEMRGVPAHGCCVFRRDVYQRVGGYRWPFYYAQDADLWLRIGEVARVGCVSEILYEFRESIGSVSARNRNAQRRFCELAQVSYQTRRASRDEAPFLAEAEELRARVLTARRAGPAGPASAALAYRLVAARLRVGGDVKSARKYLGRALRLEPLSARVWRDMILTWLN